jgi:hypothetical protein
VIVCTVTMLGLKPWEPSESVPRLAQPAFEARVGDGVAVPTVGPAVAVVEAAVAPGKAELVSRPGAHPNEGEGREGAPAVGPALAVAAPASEQTEGAPESAPPTESSPPAEVPPAAAPAPEVASVPATPPTASPPAKAPGGPVAVGTPGSPDEAGEEPGEGEEEPGTEEPGAEEPGAGEGEACAGDEYTLTIAPLEAEGEAVTIVLEHVAGDRSTETLELEGKLEDARNLVLQLSSEGGCVEVEVVSPGPTTP